MAGAFGAWVVTHQAGLMADEKPESAKAARASHTDEVTYTVASTGFPPGHVYLDGQAYSHGCVLHITPATAATATSDDGTALYTDADLAALDPPPIA